MATSVLVAKLMMRIRPAFSSTKSRVLSPGAWVMHVGYTNPVLIMRLVSMAVWATHGATKVAATTATASVEMAFMGIIEFRVCR